MQKVILADSLSTDTTVAIATHYPVTIVQLVDGTDRCCGVGAQLGYQDARGRLILLIDGDMEVDRAWLLAAMRYLLGRDDLAGVGGVVEDVNMVNLEFRARQLRKPKSTLPGDVDRLYGGGLYRREAITQVGYFTHRSLHACEELELGLRLVAAGWCMHRLNMVSIRHHGHAVPTWTLVRRRWRSRYANGAGELLRTSAWRPWFRRAVVSQALPIAVVAWWATLVMLTAGALADVKWLPWLSAVALAPVATMVARKRSAVMGLYSILAWCLDAAGLVRGLCSRPKDPTSRIESRIVQFAYGQPPEAAPYRRARVPSESDGQCDLPRTHQQENSFQPADSVPTDKVAEGGTVRAQRAIR